MNKRRYLIAASLLLLLLSASYGLTSVPEQVQPAATDGVRTQSARNGGKIAASKLPGLNLALLQADETTTYGGSKANLFRSLRDALPTRPAPSRPRPKPEPPAAPETAAEPPPPLPPPLVYLGQLREQGRQTVFLRQDDEVFLVHEGDRFGRRQEFRVTAIYPEVLMLDWDGSDIPVYIPLANSSEERSRP